MMNLLSTLAILGSSLPMITAQSASGMQTSASATSSSSSSASTSTVHHVDVGEDGLTFTPASLKVPVGDKVEFHFYPRAHFVAQSTFENPCSPISKGGFFSGVIPTSDKSDKVFTVTVNNTDPIWYYCGVAQHCQAGMVGVINPPSSGQENIEAFKSAAAKVQDSSAPENVFGGVIGTASDSSSSNSSTTTGSTTAMGSATSTASSGTSSPTKTPNAGVTVRAAGGVGSLMLAGVLSWLLI